MPSRSRISSTFDAWVLQVDLTGGAVCVGNQKVLDVRFSKMRRLVQRNFREEFIGGSNTSSAGRSALAIAALDPFQGRLDREADLRNLCLALVSRPPSNAATWGDQPGDEFGSTNDAALHPGATDCARPTGKQSCRIAADRSILSRRRMRAARREVTGPP